MVYLQNHERHIEKVLKYNHQRIMAQVTLTSNRKKSKKSKGQEDKGIENPWHYCEMLPTLMEDDKLCQSDIAKLGCQEKYYIKSVKYECEEDRHNDIYQMFGAMIGQDYRFMRQWIRVFVAMNHKLIKEIARSYFKSNISDYMRWITDMKGNGRADVLVLFLLCKLTKKHCMVHLNENRYWSTLKDEPDTHDEFPL